MKELDYSYYHQANQTQSLFNLKKIGPQYGVVFAGKARIALFIGVSSVMVRPYREKITGPIPKSEK